MSEKVKTSNLTDLINEAIKGMTHQERAELIAELIEDLEVIQEQEEMEAEDDVENMEL